MRSIGFLLGSLLVAAAALTPAAQDQATAPALPHPETGRPIIRNFSPADYGGGTQNWALIQDRRGILGQRDPLKRAAITRI